MSPQVSKLATLFSKSTGYNDASEMSSIKYTEDGTTDLIACNNLTTTPEGKLIKVPNLTAIGNISGVLNLVSSRASILAQKTSGIYSLNLTSGAETALTNAPVMTVKEPLFATPIDFRLTANSTAYKITASVVETAVLGAYVGPKTHASFSPMPEFTGGFTYNTRIYTYSGQFLQYSEPYSYDLFNLPDNFYKSKTSILAAGQIPGCVVLMHAKYVTVLVGTGPEDFVKNEYPCSVLTGTLFSGYVSKVLEQAHVFLCDDGVHLITADGKMTNVTVENTDKLSVLNTTYNSTAMQDGKYYAYGNSKCIEYDFLAKALYVSDNFIVAADTYKNKAYVATTVGLYSYGDTQNEAITAKVQLPYNHFGVIIKKQIRFLYFTGEITGTATCTVRNQSGESVTVDVSNLGYVQKHKITSLRQVKGSYLSVEFNITNGRFKMEELQASYVSCSNYS